MRKRPISIRIIPQHLGRAADCRPQGGEKPRVPLHLPMAITPAFTTLYAEEGQNDAEIRGFFLISPSIAYLI